MACDAMIVPAVTGDLAAGAVEDLMGLCVQSHPIRSQDAAGTASGPDEPDARGGPAGPDGARTADAPAGGAAGVLAMLEHQILGTILQVVSGPGGVASFLRRNLLAPGPY